MTWNYSGDPTSSELDEYRFLITDTDVKQPILQDEEINYVLANNVDKSVRLYYLFDRASNFFARDIKKSLGPQSQDPTERTKYFTAQARYYRGLKSITGVPTPQCGPPIFTIGMNDNV